MFLEMNTRVYQRRATATVAPEAIPACTLIRSGVRLPDILAVTDLWVIHEELAASDLEC
jgi:hypothetical protein